VLAVGGGASTTADQVALNPVLPPWNNVQQAVEGVLPLTGGTLTGPLTVRAATGRAALAIDATVPGQSAELELRENNIVRWKVRTGSTSDFAISRLDDAGVTQNNAIVIYRGTGNVWCSGDLSAATITNRSGGTSGGTGAPPQVNGLSASITFNTIGPYLTISDNIFPIPRGGDSWVQISITAGFGESAPVGSEWAMEWKMGMYTERYTYHKKISGPVGACVNTAYVTWMLAVSGTAPRLNIQARLTVGPTPFTIVGSQTGLSVTQVVVLDMGPR
jgi:hypothetical protein